MNLKIFFKSGIFVALLSIQAAETMNADFFVSRNQNSTISGPLIVGASLVGLGFWRGVESYCNSLSSSKTADQKTLILENFNASIGIAVLGISVLSWSVVSNPFHYVNVIIR